MKLHCIIFIALRWVTPLLAFECLFGPRIVPRAAVTSNSEACADVGMNILKQDGSAADAAIATVLCEGVNMPHAHGIGGGFVATIYDASTKSAESLIAREVAPAAAYSGMFDGRFAASIDGPLSIAVPGEIKGYWELHQKYGSLPWATLFAPTIALCRSGVLMTDYLHDMLFYYTDMIRSEPSLNEVFIDPSTDELWQPGERYTLSVLADTLETIATEGPDALYSRTGSLFSNFMADLTAMGSIVTGDDIVNYSPHWVPSVTANIRSGTTVYSTPLPASGNVLTYMLQILDGFGDLPPEDPLTWHRIVESFKHGFGMRTRLGDPTVESSVASETAKMSSPSYIAGIRATIASDSTFDDSAHYGAIASSSSDSGTGHISVLAPNGDAIAITSSINDVLGSKLRSTSTGIILNDQMDNFSSDELASIYGSLPMPANFIKPGKRPITTMTPTIVVGADGDVQLIVGAGGGYRIITSTTLLILRTVFFNEDLCSSVDAPRIHHHLLPNSVEYENGFSQAILDELINKGHKVGQTPLSRGIGYVTAVLRNADGTVSAAFDSRRTGSVAVMNDGSNESSCHV